MEICALHLKKITPNIASQENAKNLQTLKNIQKCISIITLIFDFPFIIEMNLMFLE